MHFQHNSILAISLPEFNTTVRSQNNKEIAPEELSIIIWSKVAQNNLSLLSAITASLSWVKSKKGGMKGS